MSSAASKLGEDAVFMPLFLCSHLVANGSVNSFAIAMPPSKRVACLATAIPVFAAICVHLSKAVVQTASDLFFVLRDLCNRWLPV